MFAFPFHNQNLKRLQAYRSLFLLWLLILVMGVIGFGLEVINVYSQSTTIEAPVVVKEPKTVISIASSEAKPTTTAQSLWIFDRSTQSILWEENAHQATAPASLVKMMTAVVANERLDWEEPVPIGDASLVEGNRAKFLPSDVFATKDLLRAMLLFSANDAATAVASHEYTIDEFITWMNNKAQQLGMTRSHFSNVTGMDEPTQVSTAQELGLLANHLLSIPGLADIVSQQKAVITELETGRQDVVYTTNSMLARDEMYQGVKTGTTQLAGQNLVLRIKDTWLTIDNQQQPVDLIVVILGSQDRYLDAEKLVNWLQSNLQSTQI